MVAAICYVLCGCSPERRIEPLLDQMTADERLPDTVAFNELIKIGQPALPIAVLRLQQETDPWKQQYYLILLLELGNETVVTAILPYAASNNGNVREWTAFCLGKFGDKSAIDAMIKLLGDSAVEDSAKEAISKRLNVLTDQKIQFTRDMSFNAKKTAINAWTEWRGENKPQQNGDANSDSTGATSK